MDQFVKPLEDFRKEHIGNVKVQYVIQINSYFWFRGLLIFYGFSSLKNRIGDIFKIKSNEMNELNDEMI